MEKNLPFELQLTRLSLLASVPLMLLLILVMFYANISIYLILLASLLGCLAIGYVTLTIYQKSTYQFRSLSNLLDAMIDGDYSMRAHSVKENSALDELVSAINGLADRLSHQRQQSVESQLLAKTILAHIDVAIVALSQTNRLNFANPAAKKLLCLDSSAESEELVEQLGKNLQYSSGHNQVVNLSIGRLQGRFNIHIEEYRDAGAQHKLLFITDVRSLLRQEERNAWQNLVRVISHEINNSLAPIQSISQTLTKLDLKKPNDSGMSEDMREGLKIISERATGLGQFINSYRQLAKLPEPKRQRVSIKTVIEKVCHLFETQQLSVTTEQDVVVEIDPVQFEQALINLVKNALESMDQAKSDDCAEFSWTIVNDRLQLKLCDRGVGVRNASNLFVPFYTTKKQGSGIGLLLCRQIIEAHQGLIFLENRSDVQGCCVHIEVPLSG